MHSGVDPHADELADRLADETARLAAQLHFAVDARRVPGRLALAGQPVAVTFRRPPDPARKPVHRSGSLDPALLPFLVDAVLRTRERVAYGEDEDNPYLIPLVLACFYVVEGRRTGALGLDDARGTPTVEALDEPAALRDVAGRPGALALRVIVPVEPDDGPARTAAVELTWRLAR